MGSSRRAIDFVLLAVIVGLTAATGYIHFWVGGIMLTLNAVGYAALAVAVVGSALLFRRLLPLVLIALAGYAAVTIVGWLIMGPYFSVAYLAKGIEVALIVTIAITLARMAKETQAAVSWALSLPALLLAGRFRSSQPGTPGASAADK